MNTRSRNSPDAEETEHMVDAVGIKELRHILESANPPHTAVVDHLLPVVSRESPVLTVDRESIRWSTSLRVKVEILRLMPYITAVAVHADRNVALQDYATSHGIFMSGAHLVVQYKLCIIIKSHVAELLRARVQQSSAVSLVPLLVSIPFSEVHASVFVAEVAVLSIRHEPVFILLQELFKVERLQYLFAFLFKNDAQIFRLCIVHPFVVNLFQSIKLFA